MVKGQTNQFSAVKSTIIKQHNATIKISECIFNRHRFFTSNNYIFTGITDRRTVPRPALPRLVVGVGAQASFATVSSRSRAQAGFAMVNGTEESAPRPALPRLGH